MTMRVSAVELVLRRYGCDHCGAMPGDRCTSRSGRTRAYSHFPRFKRARSEGTLPLADEVK